LFFILVALAISVVMLGFGAFLGTLCAHARESAHGYATGGIADGAIDGTQMFQLHDKVDTFAMRCGMVIHAALELSANELNALIETDPSFKALKNHLFVSMRAIN